MGLRRLRAFVAIVDAGGFARAAARVNLSQPALSRQIHALEVELGVRLFDWVGRCVHDATDREAAGRQPLTDPAVSPCTMYFWKINTSRTAGRAPRKPEAAITE